MRDLGPRGSCATLPVGISWSTIRQTRATANNHQQFQMGKPLKTPVVKADLLEVKTDDVQNRMDKTKTHSNLPTTVPTMTLNRNTSPRG